MGKPNWATRAYAVVLLCATTTIAVPAQTFTTLHKFDSEDGTNPFAGLVQATDGNLYGTTFGNGAYYLGGTFFKITPGGALTRLYAFCSEGFPSCTQGQQPFAAPVQATDGNFYGTTTSGGLYEFCFGAGCGAVFKITLSGSLTTLYSFCSQSNCADGTDPRAALIQGEDGNFYGTTFRGGAQGSCFGEGCGTVFKITPGGSFTTLHTFCSDGVCTDGSQSSAALVQATDGNFYGTTQSGGLNDDGTVFKITPSGTLTTLYSFCSQSDCTDGVQPEAGLIQATDGNFYGTTGSTVFKITPDGMLTTLHSFSFSTEGDSPRGALVQSTDCFYGTASEGGANGSGTVFKITPAGTLTTLYSFCSQSGCSDGANPDGGLVQDTNGTFYGTTLDGGIYRQDWGTVFSLSAGLGPFVKTLPTAGKVGASIKILGTNLTGATSVSFNGTPAAFTVESGSLIKATVPAGATTGIVQVVTPSRTLSSNVKFRVAP